MLTQYNKLAVIGSRATPEESKEILYKLVDQFRKKYPEVETIVSGGAIGPDSWAEEYAKSNKISRMIFEPNWYPNGKDKKIFKGAGFVRNKIIVENSDYVIAMIKIGEAKGTMNNIEWAQKMKKPYIIFNEKGEVVEKFNYEG